MSKQNKGKPKAESQVEAQDGADETLDVAGEEEGAEEVLDPAPSIEVEQKPASKKGMVKVNCVYPININGRKFEGIVEVTKDVAEVLCEMLYKKRKSDLDVHIGRNYNVDRLTDGTLIINEQGQPRKG